MKKTLTNWAHTTFKVVALFAAASNSVSIAQQTPPTKGKELAATQIQLFPSDRVSDKAGEDIPADKFDVWRRYRPNPLTLAEQKTDTFWVHTAYHGGWNNGAAFQTRDGNFLVANYFGVWRHDVKKDQLLFQFAWPFGVFCAYDPGNDCFWGSHTNPSGEHCLVNFGLNAQLRPDKIRVSAVDFGHYVFTDDQKNAWFEKDVWVVRRDDKLLMNRGYGNLVTRVSWQHSHQEAQTLYRMSDFVLQEFVAGEWRNARTPVALSGTVRCVAQRDNVVALAMNHGAFQWLPTFGLSFKLTEEFTQWIAIDGDGRVWMPDLFCLDDTARPAPTYAEFVSELPQIFSKEPIVATRAMRRLLKAGPSYADWIKKNLTSDDLEVRGAAEELDDCMNGRKHLQFHGDQLLVKVFLEGAGKTAQRLPLPKQAPAIQTTSIEKDKLIMDTHAAGDLNKYSLVETPVLRRTGFRFAGTDRALVSANPTTNEYCKVSHDGKRLRVTSVKSEGAIYSAFPGRNADELIAVLDISSGRPRREEFPLTLGALKIESGDFIKLGELSNKNLFNGHFAQDAESRLVMVSEKGNVIDYQRETNGSFAGLTTSRPGYRGNLLATGTAGRIFLYRSMYEDQWDGQHAEIFEFKQGAIDKVGAAARGHVYNLMPVSDKTLLAATMDPHGFRFIDTQSGADVEPLFDLTQPNNSRFDLLNSWAHDSEGRCWLYSTSAPNNSTEAGRLQLWDGKKLQTVLDWSFATHSPPLNPRTGCMCATEQGLIWVGVSERMLVVDSKTLKYRFFRVSDRVGAPDGMFASGEWVMANYGANATAFHLESTEEIGTQD